MPAKWILISAALTCISCTQSVDRAGEDAAARDAAYHWRDRNDPVWRYFRTDCSRESEILGHVRRLAAQVLHRSRASACDRLRAVPETTDVIVAGNTATVMIHAPDGRSADRLRLTVARLAGQWAVQKAEVSEAFKEFATIYDAREGRLQPAYSKWTPHGAAYWNITHVITYGQSLSQGFYNKPVVSTRQRYGSLRFAGGVRAQDSTGDSSEASAYSRFVPLVETQAGPKAETPSAATLDMVMQLIEQENLRNYSTLPYRFLGSAPGEGSMSIDQLSRPGQYYSQLVRDIAQGHRLAVAEGKTYGVAAVTWTQGEANDSNDTPIAEYVRKLRELRSDIDQDAKAITGQTSDVELITYQLATHRRFGQPFPHTALALLQASHEDPHIHVAVPMYLFRYVDGAHADDRSTQWFGAYYGLVLKRLLIDRVVWAPLEPVWWQRDDSTVTVRFKVPVPPLRWDLMQVAANRDYGFSLRTQSGERLPIRSVSLLGSDSVRIVAQNPVPEGTRLQYAFDGTGIAGSRYGPRGNLRDSQGDAITFDNGRETMRLDNWCVIFEVKL